jgi:hypothetical protein
VDSGELSAPEAIDFLNGDDVGGVSTDHGRITLQIETAIRGTG